METALLTIKRTVAVAALGGLFLSCAAGMDARAENKNGPGAVPNPITDPNIRHFVYDYNASPSTYVSYNMIRDVMEPVFKGTYADKHNSFLINPQIGSTEFDLNNDHSPEIIARPVDTVDEPAFCGGETRLCPNYIIDTSSGKPKVIGIIKAMGVDRGDDIKNGYWTLKAFTKQTDPANFSYYDVYAFNRKTGKYELDKTAAKPKP